MTVKTFIDRPILSGVISVAIVIVGLIGLSQLPIEQFPDIAPPTVNVSATYTGANAETVMKSVITPLEEELNGVENMMYMTSTATNTGSASINVYFSSRYVGSECAEPCCFGAGIVAGRGYEVRRNRTQEAEQLPESHLALFAR